MQKHFLTAHTQSAGSGEGWFELLPGLLLIGAVAIAVVMLALHIGPPIEFVDYRDFMLG
jgi:hypothetical protein